MHKSFGEVILKFIERNPTFTLMRITIKRKGKKKTKSSRGSTPKIEIQLIINLKLLVQNIKSKSFKPQKLLEPCDIHK
jgi:hypothetical protein